MDGKADGPTVPHIDIRDRCRLVLNRPFRTLVIDAILWNRNCGPITRSLYQEP